MKKFFKRSILFFVILAFLFFLFLKYGAYLWVDELEKNRVVTAIKSSQQLPDQFYEIYSLIYPKSLDQNMFSYMIDKEFNSIFSNKPRPNTNPYLEVISVANIQTKHHISYIQDAFYLENFVTQKECLNFWTSRVYFKNEVIGIRDGSEYLFNKELDDLNNDEIIELIITMQNPSLYDKKRRPKTVEAKIKDIKKNINYASK